MARKDLLTRLADAGEDAIGRLADAPGAHRLLDVVNTMRDRVDELQRKVRGLEELEQRVAALERRVGTEGEAPKAAPPRGKGATAPKKAPAKSPASGGSARRAGGGSPG